MDLLYFPIISYYLLLSGVGKCRINHDPTIGEIISNRYFFKGCSKSSKTNIYQALPYPLGLSKNEAWAPNQVDFRGIPKCGTYPGYGSKRLKENAEICWKLSGQILNSRRSARGMDCHLPKQGHQLLISVHQSSSLLFLKTSRLLSTKKCIEAANHAGFINSMDRTCDDIL